MIHLSHPFMTTEKNIALTICSFVDKVMSLLFNTLSRFVTAFLPRSKRFLISWLQSPSPVILEIKKLKSISFHCFPIYLLWSDGTRCHDLRFLNVEFKPDFSLSSFTLIKRLFISSLLSAIRVMSSAYLRLLIFLLAILISACASSSPTFYMMYSTYKLNKQGHNNSLDVLFSQFWTSVLIHVWVWLHAFDMHAGFSGGRSWEEQHMA